MFPVSCRDRASPTAKIARMGPSSSSVMVKKYHLSGQKLNNKWTEVEQQVDRS